MRKKREIAREINSPWRETFIIGGGIDGHSHGVKKVGHPVVVVLRAWEGTFWSSKSLFSDVKSEEVL